VESRERKLYELKRRISEDRLIGKDLQQIVSGLPSAETKKVIFVR